MEIEIADTKYDILIDNIKNLVIIAVNSKIKNIMTACYWNIGKLIHEFLTENTDNVIDPQKLLGSLSKDLISFKGLFTDNLKKMILFFENWPISQMEPIKIPINDLKYLTTLTNYLPLSWSMYKLLLSIENPLIRKFYAIEALKDNWNSNRLKAHINENLYEILNKEIKTFEVCTRKEEYQQSPVLLYQQAKEFYAVFEPFLEHGYQPLPNCNDKTSDTTPIEPYTWKNLLAYMVNYHFSIELMLKANILTKEKLPEEFTKGRLGHNLNVLLEYMAKINMQIIFNNEENSILTVLSEEFDSIRYKKGILNIRTDPPKKFIEILKCIFNKIEQEFKKNIGWIK